MAVDRYGADVPVAGDRVVSALARAGSGPVIRQAGRQLVEDDDVGGRAGSQIRDDNRECQDVADVGGRVVDGLSHGQIHELRRAGAGRVVGEIRVEWGAGDRSRVLDRPQAIHCGHEGQCRRLAVGQRADVPLVSAGVIGALGSAGCGRVGETGRKSVGDHDAGGVVRARNSGVAVVGGDDRVGHQRAHVRILRRRALGDTQVGDVGSNRRGGVVVLVDGGPVSRRRIRVALRAVADFSVVGYRAGGRDRGL